MICKHYRTGQKTTFYIVTVTYYRYIVHIFELTFSGFDRQHHLLKVIENWHDEQKRLPVSIREFDWRTFQQEYRDYIDVAKLLQRVPGIGAAVGTVVNFRLTNKLGKTARNAYRLRWLNQGNAQFLTD